MSPSPWLVPMVSDPGSGPVLLCFSYAGGGALVYRPLRPLGDVVTVIAVRTPGRESRFGEPPLPTVDAIVDAFLPELAVFGTRPLVLFGHSLGALVAFEVVRAMRRDGLASPRALIVSGRKAPTVPNKDAPVADLPRHAFLAELKELSGTPPAFFDNDELVDVMLPLLRADFGAAEKYVCRVEPKLDLPIVAYGGKDDDDPTIDEIEAWANETTGAFSSHAFPGGHFFLHDHDALLPVLRADLARLLGESSPTTRRSRSP